MTRQRRWDNATCLTAAAALAAVAAAGDRPAADDPRPTRVSVHLHGVPFDRAATAIGAAAGVPVTVAGMWEGQSAPVTVDADGKPFWQVLSDVADGAGAAISTQYDGRQTTVVLSSVGTPDAGGRRVVAGPVLATFKQVEHLAQLTAPAGGGDFCEAGVDLTWEPRLNVVYLRPNGPPTEAVDEHGLSLVPATAAAAEYDPRQAYGGESIGPYQAVDRVRNPYQANSAHYGVRLSVPPTAGRRLARLTGTLKLWVGGPDVRCPIGDLAEAAARKPSKDYKLGPTLKLRVISAQVNDGYAQAQLSVARNGLTADAWDQTRLMLRQLRFTLLDADGKEWGRSQGNAGYNRSDTEITLYCFLQPGGGNGVPAGVGKPVKLLVEGPVTATEVDVPYDLADLPLP